MATRKPVKKEQQGFAVTSMVCGIYGLVFLWNIVCIFINLPATIVGLVFGIISLAKHKGGKGMAIAGVVTAGVSLLIYLMLITLGAMEDTLTYY